ncbi:hypothetical protein JNUCC0626_23805 [Lentzea sp. JNUCC 0626]|uniref:hypothetical protein n=1 Tax=Lentzea sp. JNUCC 0626 TaxID=3367513 RepID=UPI00374A2ABC
MSTPEWLTDDELDELDGLATAATPGPWFVRALDDTHAMSLVAVSTVPDTGLGERWPDFDRGEIVAAARDGVPRLIAEIKRLRRQLKTDQEAN